MLANRRGYKYNGKPPETDFFERLWNLFAHCAENRTRRERLKHGGASERLERISDHANYFYSLWHERKTSQEIEVYLELLGRGYFKVGPEGQA